MTRLLKEKVLLLSSIFILSLITTQACNQTCGGQQFPYPFGFSSDCPIHLNCSPEGQILINQQFPVQKVTQEKIRINLEPNCNRSIQAFKSLFTRNFAPKSTNAILLHNCSSSTLLPCNIPAMSVETHFESLKCSNNSKMSCLFDLTPDGFFHRNDTQLNQCRNLLSSISSAPLEGSVSLDVQMMELGWWLLGDCHCSDHADCNRFKTPHRGLMGYQCQCKDGFDGDGYAAGAGCRQASCGVVNYLSGKCGGAAGLAILIGGISAAAGSLMAMGLVCCFIRRRSTSKAKGLRKLQLSEATGIDIPIYHYKEIEKATNSFSENQRLGTGAYGTVYAGKLHNDLWVAIKRIKPRDTDSTTQVLNEIKLISSVNHPNLVRLLGCSIENGEQILVYEFMPNGTLCQHLQREKGEGLAWPIRLTIATETAQAIAYLHSAIDPPIYHRDIKSSNILLDYNYRSKVADFGLSRLGRTEISHISTAPQGTPGYLDPQYHQNFHLSDKSDVYSFGVVLVEIITGLKVVDFNRPTNDVNLAALATDRIGKGKLEEIIDPFLDVHNDNWTLSSVYKVAEVAFRCLAFDRDVRPSMIEVAAELDQIRISRWAQSEETNYTASSNESCCSSSSNISEKALSLTEKNKDELESRGLTTEAISEKEWAKDSSPVSVQDLWLSEHSSPSSRSLIYNAI
ncbi:hypothetical protein JCGZ_04367 [Jatropha curcas]|uniref:Protein kinase domain-containing protein n=1 Tax=Jatropha curcas TaxID=180498 RepID=A0A067KQM6_JATCU|nr:wall-associated receptor kinase-like 14 [Jatropha curcas]KDP38442.1 hypothetical protein JCGZ_04367 [Jatropha curcas]